MMDVEAVMNSGKRCGVGEFTRENLCLYQTRFAISSARSSLSSA